MKRELIFYFRPTCPYCQKVFYAMANHNMAIPSKNISESSEIRDELLQIGGKTQVPCLVIDGQALHESDAIIHWIEENKEDF